MDLDEIRQILEMMREHDLAELELEREHLKLRLKKQVTHSWGGSQPSVPPSSAAPPLPAGGPPAPVPLAEADNPSALTPAPEDVDLAIVKSPIVRKGRCSASSRR
jgi:biotin carboxyl carrier protein